MQINCHVPITLRIVGVPTDDQLAAVGAALTRAVAARLAEAERLLAERHCHRAGGTATGFALASYRQGGGAGGTSTPRPPAPVAHFDAAGAKRYEEHAGALRHGGDSHEPAQHQRDVFDAAVRDAAAQRARSADGILPGDPGQQQETISEPDLEGLWHRPHVEDIFQALAQRMQAFGNGRPDAAFWLSYWHARYTASVRYILDVRPTHPYVDKTAKKPKRVTYPARTAHLRKLRDAEAELLAHSPQLRGEEAALRAMGLVHHIRQLREAARAEWLDEVNQAADRFLVVAQNEVRFRTERQNAREVQIYGLPEALEGTLPASAFPKLFDPQAPGFSPSTATFMTALQKASGQQVLAINYGGHELSNPFVGDPADVGKYSFDLQPDIPKDANGFYEHDAAVKFFLAMEQAAQDTGISWTAYYNDFSVAREVNEHIGRRLIGFSGGGGPANEPGSFHHGPAPYILHIHVNIMPRRLAQQYFAGRDDLPLSLDLGQQP